MCRLLLLLFALLMPGLPATAQELEMVQNRTFQVKYAVPPLWTVTHQRTDSVEVLRYHSPEDDARLWVGQLRGRHAGLPPARALQRLLRHLGATRHEEHRVSSHGFDFLESTGTCFIGGRELRYDARVTTYQGHVLVMYVYATPAAFTTQAPLLHRVLDSLTPLRSE
ncbi:hypothetical protein [Hymenobacter elongatus]|uniref:PsbP C-terminal domain-containing protein n=1 Tax=Hymenobacter elongatus TaxID=877208 RepID=A0A4Z0PLZ9_9BACT|nr:hypothetical protein [Hymenobacter elongatus]TGE16553.1 hypothetical protein E5J99_09220 [Hymenobacter elongatus]